MNEEEDERISPKTPFVDVEEESGRDRGLFTGIDREFLLGVKDYEHRVSVAERKQDIRKRIKNSLLDLRYLSFIEEDQRERIFEDLEENTDLGELREAVACLVQFLRLGLEDGNSWIEEAVSDGVERALLAERSGSTYGPARVTTEIHEKRPYDLDRLENQFREGRGHTLTTDEIGVLVRSGRISGEEIERLATDRSENPTFGSGNIPEEFKNG